MTRVVSYCTGCSKPQPQTTVFLTRDGRLDYLCTPCWQEADAFDLIYPWWRDNVEGVAA